MRLKNRILLVFKYLWEHTNEANSTTLEQLKDYLQSCGLSRPDSRTIKADIEQLMPVHLKQCLIQLLVLNLVQ